MTTVSAAARDAPRASLAATVVVFTTPRANVDTLPLQEPPLKPPHDAPRSVLLPVRQHVPRGDHLLVAHLAPRSPVDGHFRNNVNGSGADQILDIGCRFLPGADVRMLS